MMPPTVLSFNILSRSCTRPQTFALPPHHRALLSTSQHLHAPKTNRGNAAKNKDKDLASKKKKKLQKATERYKEPDHKDLQQYALCDAMRYLRAFEVGRRPYSPKYELAVRLRTKKEGETLKGRLRLPHPIATSRICVIAVPGSKAAKDAVVAGAVLVGEDDVFEAVKAGRIGFDKCICHNESLPKLMKSGIARILGPKGMMPSVKTKTVSGDVGKACRDMLGTSEYKEKGGIISMAIGQLAFGPLEMQRNIQAFMALVKDNMAELADTTPKEIHEVVLSSTHGPGFSLNGNFKSADSVPVEALSIL